MATASVTHTFAANTLIQSSQANTNFADLVAFLNGSVIHKDATVAFTAVPSGPATDPSSDNQFTRKRYVDVPFGYSTMTGINFADTAAVTAFPSSWTNVQARRVTATASGFTITETGLYLVGLSVGFTTSSGGTRRACGIRIAANAPFVTQVRADTPPDTGGYGNAMQPLTVIQLTAADTINCVYTQDSGADLAADARLFVMKIIGL